MIMIIIIVIITIITTKVLQAVKAEDTCESPWVRSMITHAAAALDTHIGCSILAHILILS